ncbi:MAG: hypothetical protein MUF51_11590, partial [Vicinamibacteria bacterium]|nr:hypothetical protein [Vicinamibacteria bacterium]
MPRGFEVTPQPPTRYAPLVESLRDYWLRSWTGRVLLIALTLWAIGFRLVSWPALIAWPVNLVLFGYACYYGYRGLRRLLRYLLWRIRTKLLLSYAFVGLVPIVLLALLFLVAMFVVSMQVGNTIVTIHVARQSEHLLSICRLALQNPFVADDALRATAKAHMEAAKEIHPDVVFALMRGAQPIIAGDEE